MATRTDYSAAYPDPHVRRFLIGPSMWGRYIKIDAAREIRRRRNLAINDPQPGPRTDNAVLSEGFSTRNEAE
jgi:hypothetical protein